MKKRTVLLIGKYTKEECNLSMYKQNFFVYKIDELMDLKKIKKNDLVIFFPDTPPIFPKREMIHFKDKLDVFTFQKI